MPQASNVDFYLSAAAAEAAGFRACLRCHPGDSLQAAARRADHLASRALDLIATGAVDKVGVAGLARTLGVSERQLHRRLVQALGVGPIVLAASRRSQLARLMVESTTLPLTEVAFNAGYASVRRFNESLKAALGKPPSRHRRQLPEEPRIGSTVLGLRLHYRPPLDIGALLRWLGERAITGLEEFDGTVYSRAMRLEHGPGFVELRAASSSSNVSLRASLTSLGDVASLVHAFRGLLDLDADSGAIDAALSSDATIAPLVRRRPGLRVPRSTDAFELAIRAVIGQQVSVAVGRTLGTRLVLRWGEVVKTDGGQRKMLFPTALRLAAAPLEAIGLFARRAESVRALARACASGELRLGPESDRARTREHLLDLPGIGPWTAEYIALRGLGDPDAFPASDLGIRKAARQLALPDDAQRLDQYSLRWRPWRAYAAMHLWASLGD